MNTLAPLAVLLALPLLAHGQGTKCTLRLNVHVTPDVENPRDPGFLSTLAGNPAYSLVYLGNSEESDTVILQLSGPPGTCRKQVEIMQMDSHIVDIQVMGGEGEDNES